MATSIQVNGRQTSIPGVYSTIKSGIRNPAPSTSYGNICIIDVGMGSGFTGGAGINGTQMSGVDAVYFLSNLATYQAFMRGGIYYDIGELLFSPNGNNNAISGTSGVFYIKAATTAPATKQITLSAQTITFKTKDEGASANGQLSGSNLSAGYGFKVFASTVNVGKYYISFYVSSFKGTDALPAAFVANANTYNSFINPLPLDGIFGTDAIPTVICSTGDFASINELCLWLNNSNNFNDVFSYSISTPASTVAITGAEVAAIAGYQLFAGATESYSPADFDNVLSQIANLDNTFFLAPHYAENALSIYNTKLLYHIQSQSRFEKFLYVGGGNDKTKLRGSGDSSVTVAGVYNSDKVQLVHGGYRKNLSYSKTPIQKASFYAAAKMLGRISGTLPYNPCTFKKVNIDGLLHTLSQDEQQLAIKAGVMYFLNDPELGFAIAHDSNTLQINDYLVNEDATSYSHTVKRILAQISKMVVIEAKRKFFGSERGVNRFTASPEDVIAWTKTFLDDKKASDGKDNYLLRVGSIIAASEQDNLRITYESVPNGPINKMIFTNLILSA